jgi:hypothetical protein
MQNKKLYKITSALLLFTYLNLIAITVFHFHVINLNSQTASIDSSCDETNKIIDPFSNGDSNCSVTQFSSSSYINENNFFNQKTIIYNIYNYPLIRISSKPLQVISEANLLRAPPLAS